MPSSKAGRGPTIGRALLPALALVFTACTAGTTVQAPLDDEDLVLGQVVYANNCASCHRADGAGGRGGALTGDVLLEAYPNPDDQRAMIAAGRRAMPGFDGRLTAEQLDAVVRYTREVLGNATRGE